MGKHVVVIGAGAAGLTAAIWAAETGAGVTLLEHTGQIGKKLLSTGNGRCNLTNANLQPEYYRGSQPGFVSPALSAFGWADTLDWFAAMGLLTKARMGTYYYPLSDQAGAVLDTLRFEAERQNIALKLSCEVSSIAVSKAGPGEFVSGRSFILHTNQGPMKADAVVLACGSKAAPATGSDGTGYALAKAMGHRIIKPLPALAALRCQGNYKQMAGIRTEAKLTLLCDGQKTDEQAGELQLTDYGLSGIPTFQLSRYAAEALEKQQQVTVLVDFLPQFTRPRLKQLLDERSVLLGERRAADFLIGIMNKKLALCLLKRSAINPDEPFARAGRKQREKLLGQIKSYEALVMSVNPYASAQVCCGGVDTAQVNARTMESMLVPGLYFAGEMLDVDGICGGYNLQWAWSSGHQAGLSAALEESI